LVLTAAAPTTASSPSGRPAHARVIALLGIVQAMVFLAGLVRWKVVALLLGPSGVGVASVIDQIAQVVLNVGSLSLPVAALRFLSMVGPERRDAWARLYRVFLRTILVSSTGIGLVSALILVLRPEAVNPELSVVLPAVVLGLAAVPFAAATLLSKSALATLGKYYLAAVITFLGNVLLVAATYFGIRWDGLTGMYAGSLIVGFGVFLALRLVVGPAARAGSGGAELTLRGLAREHPEIVRFCAGLYVVSFTTAAMYGVTRYAVLAGFGAEAAGFLAAAYAIGTAVRLVFGEASVQYLIPAVSRQAAGPERGREVDLFVRSLALLVVVVGLPAMLFPSEVLTVLYSPRFTQAVSFLGLFILGEAVMVVADAYRAALIGVNDPVGYVGNPLLGHAVVIVGTLVVLPRFGIVGLGVSHVVGSVLVLAANVARLRLHGIRGSARSAALIGYATLALAGAAVLGRVAPQPAFGVWLWKAGVGAALAGGALLLVPAAERALALARLRPRRGERR
jgi:PST family polysaccharide transporter